MIEDKIEVTSYLQKIKTPKDATLETHIEKDKLAEIGIDYQGEKDP